MPAHDHERALKILESEYKRKGYQTVINSADRIRIPDLLMIDICGRLLWIEVERSRDSSKSRKFRELRDSLVDLNGKLHIRYLMAAKGVPTSLGKRAINDKFAR